MVIHNCDRIRFKIDGHDIWLSASEAYDYHRVRSGVYIRDESRVNALYIQGDAEFDEYVQSQRGQLTEAENQEFRAVSFCGFCVF